MCKKKIVKMFLDTNFHIEITSTVTEFITESTTFVQLCWHDATGEWYRFLYNLLCLENSMTKQSNE